MCSVLAVYVYYLLFSMYYNFSSWFMILDQRHLEFYIVFLKDLMYIFKSTDKG